MVKAAAVEEKGVQREMSITKPQGRYVMLSRVRTLAGLAVLRPFSSMCFSKPLQPYIKSELRRISELATQTAWRYRNLDYDGDETDDEEDWEMEVETKQDPMLVDVDDYLVDDARVEWIDEESDSQDEFPDSESEALSDYAEEYMLDDDEF